MSEKKASRTKTEASIFADDRYNLVYFALTACLFAIELAALGYLHKGYWLVMVHLGVSIIPTLLVFFALRMQLDLRLPLLTWIAVVLFGPFGSAGICFFF